MRYIRATDISERVDLAKTEPEQLARMAQRMTEELKSKEALMPTIRLTGEILPYPNQLIKSK